MHLTLVLTHACNLGCPYCYAGKKDARTMPEATGRRAIDWALARTGDELLIGYFGGEPLLRFDLLQRLHAYARERGAALGVHVRGTVTTNGTLLDDVVMDWMTANDVVVGVSIDGADDLHDAQRPLAGGGRSSAQVRRGLSAALRRAPLTQTISVVTPQSAPHLVETVTSLRDAGVRVMSLSLDPSADWDLSALDAYRTQLDAVGDLWLAAWRSGRELYIDPIDGKITARIKGGLAACDRCDAGGGELALSPGGNWYGCERLVGADDVAAQRWALGSIHTGDGAPDATRVAALRRRTMPAECQSCPVRERCVNDCACSNIMALADPAAPGGAQCAAEQCAIATADRVAAALYADGHPRFLRQRYRLTA